MKTDLAEAAGWLASGDVFGRELWRYGWGCHQCGAWHWGPFLWVAKRRSVRHEREAHGFSAYD